MAIVAIKRGRPPKYATPADMELLADQYLADCVREDEPLTVTGLALALDLDRKSLVNYAVKPEFLPTLKRYKSLVETSIEKRLLTQSSVAGSIFNLKNNFDWKDTQVVEHTGELNLVNRIREGRERGIIDVTPAIRELPDCFD